MRRLGEEPEATRAPPLTKLNTPPDGRKGRTRRGGAARRTSGGGTKDAKPAFWSLVDPWLTE